MKTSNNVKITLYSRQLFQKSPTVVNTHLETKACHRIILILFYFTFL